jgi:hypothetical protein
MMVKRLGFIFAGVAVMGTLWLAFTPQHDGLATLFPAIAAVPAGEMASTDRQQRASAAALRREVFEIDVRGGRVVSGFAPMQVHEGDEITLKIISDRSDEIHLHGYDLHARIVPGETAMLAFTATRTGRFGLEMHHSHVELGTLEVYPN